MALKMGRARGRCLVALVVVGVCCVIASLTAFAAPAPNATKNKALRAGRIGRIGDTSYEHVEAEPMIGLETPVALFSLGAAAVALRSRVQRKGGTSLVRTGPDTYKMLADKGAGIAKQSFMRILIANILGGCYVGMAGLLSLAVAGDLDAPSIGAQKFVFAALFPINLLLVLQTGCQLFTGNTANQAMAVFEKKINVFQALRVLIIAYIGNMIGCGLIAFMANYTGILAGGAAEMATKAAIKKTSYTFGQTLVKAVFCNWLVCMAVWLSTSAEDLTSKMVGIWFPISMFVATGFEHSVANFFILPAGILAGAPLTVKGMIMKNWIPVTIGNFIAGAGVMAGSLCYMFGRFNRALVRSR